MAIANGAPIGDIDEVIRRNAGRVSHADVMAGRLSTVVLGDILTTVDQAKGSKPFNWSAATPAEIKAYLLANGITPHDHGRNGIGVAGGDRSGDASSRDSTSASGSNVAMSAINERNYAHFVVCGDRLVV